LVLAEQIYSDTLIEQTMNHPEKQA
jgi:hypothetical protein